MDPITRLNRALEGRYRIERELGEGGMATVYLADDLKHERKVALKLLRPELAAVVGAERFLSEIRTTANHYHSVAAGWGGYEGGRETYQYGLGHRPGALPLASEAVTARIHPVTRQTSRPASL